MNIRAGKELFAEMIDSWYDKFDKTGTFGFLRDIKEKGVIIGNYIAEHVALRSLFLDNTINYKFRNGLINVFNTPGLEGYKSVLIQLRILEVLDKYKNMNLKRLFEVLNYISYNNEEVVIGLYHLKEHRLISTKPVVFELKSEDKQTEIFIRFRGRSYLSFIKKLSYIQIVYFMTELPMAYSKKFNYPDPPLPSDLRELSDNFLHSIDRYIKYEQNNSSQENLTRYEYLIRPLQNIHSEICEILQDLHSIFKFYENL